MRIKAIKCFLDGKGSERIITRVFDTSKLLALEYEELHFSYRWKDLALKFNGTQGVI